MKQIIFALLLCGAVTINAASEGRHRRSNSAEPEIKFVLSDQQKSSKRVSSVITFSSDSSRSSTPHCSTPPVKMPSAPKSKEIPVKVLIKALKALNPGKAGQLNAIPLKNVKRSPNSAFNSEKE